MRAKLLASLIPFLLTSGNLHAQSVAEEDALMRAYGDEDFISIATGTRQLISQAPAVATVITADDIKAMGATDLDQILETVPGLHVSNSPRAYSPLYTIRGIYTESNPQVLILINDIPITNIYVGDRSQVWGGMPVNNISRIEIIRGPGSAVYGADAYAGTINIITKTPDDIGDTQFGARAGSYNTREGWVQHGGNLGQTDFAVSLEILRTDGQDRTIDTDAQSFLDSSVSLAPGSVNLGREILETRIDLHRGSWRFRAGYQGRRDVETGAGVAQALDPAGTNSSDRFNADLTYNTYVSRDWDITAQMSLFDSNAKSDLVLFPPGAFGGAFPDGVIGSPYVYERHTRGGLSAFYHGIQNHNIRIGIGGIHNDLYKTRERKNFALDGSPLGGIIDVSGDPSQVFIQPQDRKVYYGFIQDEWSINSDWKLTGGVRYDHYSDFGDTTNPRLAIVWRTRYDLTTKVLYGRAFRAPAFNELYNINNPVALGNPNLKPEKIDTYELAFNYQPAHNFQAGLNLFTYHMSDIIRFVPDPAPATSVSAQNSGNRDGYGLELEFKYDVSRQFLLLGNYAYQNSTEKDTDSDVANAPQHQVYLRTVWRPIPDWSFSAQVNWVADRSRDITDPRPRIDDYIMTDLTLRYRHGATPWEFAILARNIFDEDAREPSPAPGSIPNDLPLAGQHFLAEVRYHLDNWRGK